MQCITAAMTAHASMTERQITVRLPAHLLEKIERERARLAAASPGVAFTNSDVVRSLLLTALDGR